MVLTNTSFGSFNVIKDSALFLSPVEDNSDIDEERFKYAYRHFFEESENNFSRLIHQTLLKKQFKGIQSYVWDEKVGFHKIFSAAVEIEDKIITVGISTLIQNLVNAPFFVNRSSSYIFVNLNDKTRNEIIEEYKPGENDVGLASKFLSFFLCAKTQFNISHKYTCSGSVRIYII